VKQKLLITGGAGFIGRAFVEKFYRQYSITIVDSLEQQIHGTQSFNPFPEKVKFIKANILDIPKYQKELLSSDILIHLASETGTGQSMHEMKKYYLTNAQGTANLIEFLFENKNNIKKIILSSSRSVYGEGAYQSMSTKKLYFPNDREQSDLKRKIWEFRDPDDSNCFLNSVPTKEDCFLQPKSIYASTKLSQEHIVQNYSRLTGTQSYILRFQNVYGQGQSLKNPYTGIISIFSNLIRQDLKLNIFEDGMESRDFINVTDVINVLERCIEAQLSSSMTLNVGTGIQNSVLDISKLLFSILKKPQNYEISGEYRLGDIRHNFADISRLKIFYPEFKAMEITEGLELFVEWLISQPVYKDSLKRVNQELRKMNLLIKNEK